MSVGPELAIPSGMWTAWWLYAVAPSLAMLLAA
jgi:hypothetical protein